MDEISKKEKVQQWDRHSEKLKKDELFSAALTLELTAWRHVTVSKHRQRDFPHNKGPSLLADGSSLTVHERL